METQPARTTWTLRDPILVFVFSLFASIIAVLVAVAFGYIDAETIEDEESLPRLIMVAAVAQFAVMYLGLRWLSRNKGTGDMRKDFHLHVRMDDWVAYFWGVGLLLGGGLIMSLVFTVFGISSPTQEVVTAAETADNLFEKILITLVIGLAAPIVEEMLFRGVLLDTLLARWPVNKAVWVGGVVFGLVHLTDPATLTLVPALIALGVILGYVRHRTGSLSRPILMHVGFNSVTAIGLFFAL